MHCSIPAKNKKGALIRNKNVCCSIQIAVDENIVPGILCENGIPAFTFVSGRKQDLIFGCIPGRIALEQNSFLPFLRESE